MKEDKSAVCFGEVLWDCVFENRFIGGAPLNVCYHLLKAGIRSRVVSRVGTDAEGTELISGIKKLGVDPELIAVGPGQPTSKVLVNLSADGQVSYEIRYPVAWDHIAFDERIAREISEAACLIYGSLICRSPVSKETLMRYLPYARWRILDLNLRSPFYDEDLVRLLLSTCHTLKINEDELSTIFAMPGMDAGTERGRAAQLFQVFPDLSEIIVTRGASGADHYSRSGKTEVGGIKVAVADTVGCGDSFLAAYVAGKLKNKPIGTCLKDAVTLSAFIAGFHGACPVYTPGDVGRRFKDKM